MLICDLLFIKNDQTQILKPASVCDILIDIPYKVYVICILFKFALTFFCCLT